MNQKNVEALTELMRGFEATDEQVRDPSSDIRVLVAKYLAARGVLVPSALTDDEAFEVGGDMQGTHSAFQIRADANGTRAELERIAKGEN